MKIRTMTINFYSLTNIRLNNRTNLKLFLTSIAKKEKTKIASVDIIFCSDEYLLQINKDFLQHDYYTDIITFDLTRDKKEGIISEIYISVDRIRENAKEFVTTINRETHRVIFHGILHLCGFKDKSTKDKKTMVSKEDYYLNRYFN